MSKGKGGRGDKGKREERVVTIKRQGSETTATVTRKGGTS